MKPEDCKRGTIVVFNTLDGPEIGCITSDRPFVIGFWRHVSILCGDGVHIGRRIHEIKPAPTEYHAGKWRLPTGGEADGCITYAFEPSPETGHEGWCWWAHDRAGEARSYADARTAVERVVRRREAETELS